MSHAFADRCINQHGKVLLARSPLFACRTSEAERLTTSWPTQTGLTQACLESESTMEQVDELVSEYVSRHFPPGSRWPSFPFALSPPRSTNADTRRMFVFPRMCHPTMQLRRCSLGTRFTPTSSLSKKTCRALQANCTTASSTSARSRRSGGGGTRA